MFAGKFKTEVPKVDAVETPEGAAAVVPPVAAEPSGMTAWLSGAMENKYVPLRCPVTVADPCQPILFRRSGSHGTHADA